MTTASIDPGRLALLDTVTLAYGSHAEADKAYCAMELVSYLAGEPHSDHPKCASPVLTAFVIRLNDRWPEDMRQALKPYLPRIIGTAGDKDADRRRGFLAADWAARVAVPVWMRRAKLDERAAALEALAPITDRATADAARPVIAIARNTAAADAYAYAAADAYAARKSVWLELQPSALELLDRMIAVGKTPVPA